jgi:hypothetical protein
MFFTSSVREIVSLQGAHATVKVSAALLALNES